MGILQGCVGFEAEKEPAGEGRGPFQEQKTIRTQGHRECGWGVEGDG